MLIGIGCDLLIKDRLAKILQGPRQNFLRRLCHADEVPVAALDAERELRYFCQLWVIKEACSKALGTGITAQVPLSAIMVSCPPDRAPGVVLYDGAKLVMEDIMGRHNCKKYNILVSVSDEKNITMATVVIDIC